MIIGLLFNLAVLTAIGFGISRLLKHRGNRRPTGPPADPRQSVVRFIRLALLLGGVVLVAEGAAEGIGDLARRADGLAGNPTTLARALAFTVVGIPALAGLTWWTRRELAADPLERNSTGWATYLAATTLLGLAVSVPAWHEVLRALFGAADLDHRSIGAAITWTAAWAVHWRLWNARRAAPTGPDLHLVCGSALGAVFVAAGLGRIVAAAGGWAYDALIGNGDVRLATLSDPAAMAIVDGAVWVWYWLTHMRGDLRTSAWHAYVLLLGVLGSITTFVVGGAVAVHALLQWWLGDPAAPTAALHFDVLPGAAGALVIGLLGWGYHRSILGRGDRTARTEVDRLYDYLAAAVGLVATTVGVTVGFASLIAVLVRPEGKTVANAVVLAITLVLVGAPIWITFWRGLERRVDHVERRSLTRRTYLVLLFGASAATAMISMVVLLYIAFVGLTRGNAANPTLYRIRIPLGLVLALGTIAGYHAVVARHDRGVLAAETARLDGATTTPPTTVRDVVIVASGARACADEIHRRLGARVQVWRPASTPAAAMPVAALATTATLPTVDTDTVMAALATATSDRVLLIARPDGSVESISFHQE